LGFVVMPEHVHLLIGEPKTGNPSMVLYGRVAQAFALFVDRLTAGAPRSDL
jgi:REP element-mobilizing transposase RayT